MIFNKRTGYVPTRKVGGIVALGSFLSYGSVGHNMEPKVACVGALATKMEGFGGTVGLQRDVVVLDNGNVLEVPCVLPFFFGLFGVVVRGVGRPFLPRGGCRTTTSITRTRSGRYRGTVVVCLFVCVFKGVGIFTIFPRTLGLGVLPLLLIGGVGGRQVVVGTGPTKLPTLSVVQLFTHLTRLGFGFVNGHLGLNTQVTNCGRGVVHRRKGVTGFCDHSVFTLFAIYHFGNGLCSVGEFRVFAPWFCFPGNGCDGWRCQNTRTTCRTTTCSPYAWSGGS